MGKKHTIEDYKEVGVLFKQADEMIGNLIVKTSNLVTKYCRPLEKAHSIINKIRSDLEDEMFKEIPEATTHIFYGKRET